MLSLQTCLQHTAHETWLTIVPETTDKQEQLFRQYLDQRFYPEPLQVFRALTMPLRDVRVVILGQDPYINCFTKHDGSVTPQACGLAFAVPGGCPAPPSLKNIHKVLGLDPKSSDQLQTWTKQGVLLLNTALTVLPGKSNSHARHWRHWTDQLIQQLSDTAEHPIVWLLWGRQAQKKRRFIGSKHPVLETSHPSPLSCRRGFMTSDCFNQANQVLRSFGRKTIQWTT